MQSHPLYNRLPLSTWNKIKLGICIVTLVPVRVTLWMLIMSLLWLMGRLSTLGVDFDQSQKKPLAKWRQAIRWMVANVVFRGLMASAGFIWKVKGKGNRAKPEEAPIYVVAPHSSFFDMFIVSLLGAPSVVAKMAMKDMNVFGTLVTLTQAVYVARENKESRKNSMEVLVERAQGIYKGSGMPQIMIFPEGTCSNRASLIQFKPGAFTAAVPVQPVLVRYPNYFDAVTWTFDGTSYFWSIVLTFAQPVNFFEIEFMPVYSPSKEEQQDPVLYAHNVRAVMARALGIPTSDQNYISGLLLNVMRDSTKVMSKLRSIFHAKSAFGEDSALTENQFMCEAITKPDFNWEMNLEQFQRNFYHLSFQQGNVSEVVTVFDQFRKDSPDYIDVRPYLFLSTVLFNTDKRFIPAKILKQIFGMYDINESDIDGSKITTMIESLFEIPEPNNNEQQWDVLKPKLLQKIENIKLFADEVAHRLPIPYPRFQDRDKVLKPIKSE